MRKTNRVSRLRVMLYKSANRNEVDEVYKEHLKMEEPLPSLMRLYIVSKEKEREDYFQLFKDRARADEFYEMFHGNMSLSDEEERELIEEFGREAVDRYIYGMGADYLVGDDYQEILLKLLDTHGKLKRRRDKSKIKQRFDIYHY